MQKAFAKFFAFFYIALAFSTLAGIHLHTELGQKIPRLVIKNSAEDKAKDHRSLPEPEKSLLEYFLQNSLKGENPPILKITLKGNALLLAEPNTHTKNKPTRIFQKEFYLPKENQVYILLHYFLPPPFSFLA